MKALRWVVVLLAIATGEITAAAERGYLALHFRPDGALDAYFYTDDNTQEYSPEMAEAWAAFVEPQAVSEIEDVGALQGTRIDAATGDGLIRRGTVSLAPLQAALAGMDLEGVNISVEVAPASHHELSATGLDDFERYMYRSELGGYEAHGTWDLEGAPPVIEVAYGHTFIGIYKGLIPLVLIGSVCLVWAAMARVNASRAPKDDVPFLCFRCSRHYDWVLYATWFAGYQYFRMATPFDWLLYCGPWFERHAHLPPFILFCLAIGLPLVLTRVLLHPIFARYPDTTWTASSFLAQGIWANLWMTVLAAGFYLARLSAVEDAIEIPVPFIIGGAIGLLFLFSHFYQRSLGIRSQILGEGELYDEIRETAALLNQKPNIEMLYYHQCPLGNVFQVGSGLVQVSNVALATLTKSEFRALLLNGFVQAEKEKQGLATGGVAAAGALSVWGSVAAISYELFKRVKNRGGDKATPLSELEEAVDQRALVRGLVKIDRLNQTLQGKVRAGRPFQRNRELEKKVQEAATLGEIGPWELDALLALEDLGDHEYYQLPGGEEEGELLETSSRRRASWIFALLAFLLPLLPGVVIAAYQVHTGHYLGHDYWVLGGAVVAGAVLLYLLQNYGDIEHGKPRRVLARRLREAGAFDDAAHFVGLASRPERNGTVRYDGSETWDEGFLSLTANAIVYQGERASFSIPRERVRNIRYTCEFPGILLPFYRVRVDWLADGHEAPRTFTFTAETTFSRARANRNTRRLYQEFLAWYRQDAAFRPASVAAEFPIPHTLDPTASVMDHAPLTNTIAVFILMPLCGFAASLAAGIPADGPLSANSTGIIIVSLGGAAVLSLITLFHAFYGVKTIAAMVPEGDIEHTI